MAPSGQIGKRLQIIQTAISLTDDETINLQRSKLRVQKNDAQLDTILSVLDDENYAQASNLIDRYLRGPFEEEAAVNPQKTIEIPEENLPPEADQREKSRTQEEAELIKKFGLFMNEASKEEYNPISEEEIYTMSQSVNSDTIPSEEEELTLPPKQPKAEEILAHYETIQEETLPQSDMINKTSQKRSTPQTKRKEDFDFGIDEIPLSKGAGFDEKPYQKKTREPEEQKEIVEEVVEEYTKYEEGAGYEEVEASESVEVEELEEQPEELSGDTTLTYAPISYIDQKLRNMRNQYPQVEETSERFESEERLLYMISLEGYSEADIEHTIDKVFALLEEGKLGESAHLLLIAAATESLYAQFILARELYKGKILQRDLPEAFTQINRLAMNDYPEAVCDLAQFYENGIGIGKDKKKALELYEDALELGSKRADAHLSRIEQSSRGILGKLFGK